MTNPDIVLQVFLASSGEWAGRLMDGFEEHGRIAGCASLEEVVAVAIEAGLEFARIEKLDRVPLVNNPPHPDTIVSDITGHFFGD